MNEPTDTLVNYGGEIKMLQDDGDSIKIGGHLVLFGSPNETDFARDYFTKSTDFDIAERPTSTVYYHHGLNPTLKARKLGTATLRIDDDGVWMETELKARDRYEQRVIDMVRAGKMGLSSGSAAHLVERKAVGKAFEIVRWPLGLDASLTPTPCDPRTSALPLKSLIDEGELGEDAPAAESSTKTEIPDDAPPAGKSFADHSKSVLAAIEEFTERAESLADIRCVKSNRRWSQANYDLLNDAAAELLAAGEAMKSLAQAHAPQAVPAATAEEEPTENAVAATEKAEFERAALNALAQIEITKARLNGVPV